MKKKYIKSPLNYTGGKHRLMGQLEEKFPDNINQFVDLFTGGANVVVNVNAKKYFAYDINDYLIKLFLFFSKHTYKQIVDEIESIITHYGLSDSTKNGYDYYGCDSSKGLGSFNSEKYKKLREDFNKKDKTFNREILFYTMVVYAFNNQIRFNSSGGFNMPVGKRDFNKNIRNNLKNFVEAIHQKSITFKTSDFRNTNFDFLVEGDFVYCDPPYLITTATYNEQDGWTEKEEKDLLSFLDELHSKKIKFALSNVLSKDGRENEILKEWSKKYDIHDMNINYSNSNYHKKDKGSSEREVLITNY